MGGLRHGYSSITLATTEGSEFEEGAFLELRTPNLEPAHHQRETTTFLRV